MRVLSADGVRDKAGRRQTGCKIKLNSKHITVWVMDAAEVLGGEMSLSAMEFL